MRHRGTREAAQYPGIGEGVLEKPEQQSEGSPEGSGGRGQKDLKLHPPEAHRTEGSLTLGDIFIAVKTTKKFHQSRVELLLDTWISQASEQVSVWILTREKVLVMGRDGVSGQGDKSQRKGKLGTVVLLSTFLYFSLHIQREMLPRKMFHQ